MQRVEQEPALRVTTSLRGSRLWSDWVVVKTSADAVNKKQLLPKMHQSGLSIRVLGHVHRCPDVLRRATTDKHVKLRQINVHNNREPSHVPLVLSAVREPAAIKLSSLCI